MNQRKRTDPKSQLIHKPVETILRLIINKNNSKKLLFFDSKWTRYMQKKLLKPVNRKVSKNKTGQKKHISNCNTNPKQHKNNSNTSRMKKTY